ncbi:hypothetical protein FHEFKHOI_01880 [Candidatus Methanoperedenaceae archaeon GB50]|nr:hypothetical protein AIOGIFDO_01871 [Candidatus Methanoperedenaceae archaeon GB37]CAD7776125.1 hypothetical protein FHEFKHOI_01880 [Candidatus Methanoperedenaceae archaeon GB50]CAD7780132.1 MAG: hypothetical protein KBONHNOK_01418 [Candidatus Methanoperedenaceae archaeon GB50]
MVKKMGGIDEEELVDKLAPIIEERIRYKIVRGIIDTLEEQFYPPEEMFTDEFIERVKEAEKRVKEGKTRSFKDAKELNEFLESLKDE